MLTVLKYASKENISVIEDLSDCWQFLLTESTPCSLCRQHPETNACLSILVLQDSFGTLGTSCRTACGIQLLAGTISDNSVCYLF